jgi:galactokinase/mevalonate kinase-like predicted kinase
MITASAPGRCGIVGNPTDGYGGTVISSSLAERATVEITPADGVLLDICGDRERITGLEQLVPTGSFTDVAKVVLQAFPDAVTHHGFRIRGATTVPIQGGLAGSTAMLVAILGALLRMLGQEKSPYEIAETVRRIEFDILKVVCGFQDQYMTVFGGVNYLDFRGKEPHASGAPVYATVERLEPFVTDLPLILANTGVQHHSGTVHKGLRERWIDGAPDVVEGYLRAARLAREGKKALVAGDWARLGELMNENHAIQRDLGGSGESNENLIAAALRHGALGAKLAGAGKGGTIIAVHEDPDYLGRKLMEGGAARVLKVAPSQGLMVEGSI